ncbi:MAG TPA: triose-phosphate isomerase [Terriglobia bacterium]|nr:triose-phosphate isomerase [Terriglobia bacterium]
MSRQCLFLGSNWKMNKTVSEAVTYISELLDLLSRGPDLGSTRVFVIPPFTAIQAVKALAGGKIWVGAQNMHWAESGAYTGEISPPMLQELGVDLVELGHAERRQHFNETDTAVNLKVISALHYNLRPLICVGESQEDKEYVVEKETVGRQLRISLRDVPPGRSGNIIIAYEPFWAIGHDRMTADVDHIRMMSQHIRAVLEDLFGNAGGSIPVIYGGDVNGSNALRILIDGGVDGLFVGRAAWEAPAFASLIQACIEVARNSA